MRVYWPTTLGALGALQGNVLATGPVVAHAVTPALRDYYAGWECVKYNEDVGELHRTDAQGNRIKQRFATALMRKA